MGKPRQKIVILEMKNTIACQSAMPKIVYFHIIHILIYILILSRVLISKTVSDMEALFILELKVYSIVLGSVYERTA